ncbi:hypothetical protein [uncultured Ilyobacter sp.]|uniref:hypothetical protein n=1 Tax=uncultured Ilyobacter sp. TaxID=544433 RepID=UPI0029C71ACC|nr:hypothetical protein [uncultured Ilyobacter sp.]
MEKRFEYEFALKEYEKFCKYIREKGFRCDASGSLRREREDVGDIDVVIEGTEEIVLEAVGQYPQIEKAITRYEFILKSGICIHAIPETKEKYVYTLWHSTGPKAHVKFIEGVYAEKGTEIDEENISEEEIYHKIDLDYMKPAKRYKFQEVEDDQGGKSQKDNKNIK